MQMDSSAVFHRDMLDAEHAAKVPAETPWLFETDQGAIAYISEDAACEAQRAWRTALGYHPITGEKIR
jgi:hypothetical protein